MFARSPRGLLDFLAAALCLWAAAWHTPAGALVRTVAARLTDSKTTARPLLAYYSGGVYELPRDEVTLPPPPPLPGPEVLAVADGDSLGRGVLAAMAQARPQARRFVDDTAQRLGRPSPTTPAEASALVGAARTTAGFTTDDGAVLALFAGVDVARFADQRVRAEGRDATLEALAARLPPGSPAVEATSAALMYGTAYALSWPLPPNTRVTSGFGTRNNPVTGHAQLHGGIDLAVPEGTEVHAVADGVVRRAGEDAINGKIVIVDHGHGVWTAYCHNSELRVSNGQRVRLGEIISRSGTTGRSTGPHLHYQLELGHRPIDPFLFRAGRPVVEPVPVAPLPGAIPPAHAAASPKPAPRGTPSGGGPTGPASDAPPAPGPSDALRAALEKAQARPPEEGGTDATE